ncbi:hypothetical protein B7463_g630, partial [Scytalidium lignicola]
MPSTAAGPRMYENHIPSFMSVYDMDPNTMQSRRLVDQRSKETGNTYSNQPSLEQPRQQSNEHEHAQAQHQQQQQHQHRESTSTHASDSTDSSPTTTISTIDSSSLSDPSPSSSPESPVTLVPLSSFAGSTFGLDSFQSLKMADSTACIPLNDDRPMTSPSPRRAKNPKSLALNLAPSIDGLQDSAPSSPSFIKPPTLKGKKRPSLLSLNTGAANLKPLTLDPLASPSMPTMLQRRSLKHSVSSPQISSTPGLGPAGGMTLGDFTKGLGRSKLAHRGLSTTTIDEVADQEAPAAVQMATRVPGASVGGDSFDRPPSNEDAVSPAYPEGPILMHEPSVHLYLEPKLDEAMKFDVIINVAREVKNPFELEDEDPSRKASVSSISSDPTSAYSRNSIMTPDTGASMMSFKTAFEVQPFSYDSNAEESSPTTPRPSITSPRRPEYIHVPWDHNTDVKDELWDLCQLIESRTKDGKRVLVHCQQGASRSATLIIAYGMYLNPDLTANEAYAQAQAKSRWVNPNMSLLFSLNDFKKIIDGKRQDKNIVGRKVQAKHRPSLSADAVDGPPTPSRARGNSTPNAAARDAAIAKEIESKQRQLISNFITPNGNPGFDFGFGFTPISKPPSAPPPPPPVTDSSEPKVTFDFGFAPVPTASNTLPAITHPRYPQDDMAWESSLMSPRLTEMTHNPLQNPFPRSFPMELEVPQSPGVFSPRTFEFPSSIFPVLQATTRNSLALEEDPRSPPTKGETTIIRSIDDVL